MPWPKPSRPRRPERVASDAVEAGLRSLRHRDLTAEELERKLTARGFSEDECQEAVATLRRTGLLDERRFAENRARSLASRGAGDAFIGFELERAGVPSELVEDALVTLEPELERARALVARRGATPKTARYLAGKGFSPETIAAAVASGRDEELG
jgi:SOS response regulatory protein OraA/RecX